MILTLDLVRDAEADDASLNSDSGPINHAFDNSFGIGISVSP